MNKRLKKKQTQKLCMYFCMNAYPVSFNNVDFCGIKIPPLVSGFVKKISVFSALSKQNIEKQFKKGLLIFYSKNKGRCIIWEHKLSLLKAENLTKELINLVIEMYKLRLTVLKEFVENLFSLEDAGYVEVLRHDLKSSETGTNEVISRIESSLEKSE